MLILLFSGLTEAEVETPATSGHGFVITDTSPVLWWQRKPKAMPEEVAERKVRKIAGTIERIASKHTAPTVEAKREIVQAIRPQLDEMPGFDWTPIYQAILFGLHIRQQEQQAEAMQAAQIRMARDEDDLLVLLMAA